MAKKTYAGLDVSKFVMALLVLMLHTNPFQDINNDNSFKVEFSQVMNLKQNNVDTKQSLLDKVNSPQSNNKIPDMDNDDANKFL